VDSGIHCSARVTRLPVAVAHASARHRSSIDTTPCPHLRCVASLDDVLRVVHCERSAGGHIAGAPDRRTGLEASWMGTGIDWSLRRLTLHLTGHVRERVAVDVLVRHTGMRSVQDASSHVRPVTGIPSDGAAPVLSVLVHADHRGTSDPSPILIRIL
jgi:hypothetical protein